MKWSDKLKEWDNGIPQKYPSNIKKRFFYETTSCDNQYKNKYNEIFIESDKLEKLEYNSKSFDKHIKESKNNYVTSFMNLSNTSLLIIPIPKNNKKYTTIKEFIDLSSKTQQIYFWKYVSKKIKEMLKENEKVYISTHGLGVPYFHLRIDLEPKYYISKLGN